MNFKLLHPFLIGIFPILFLFARNATEMEISETVFPLVLVLIITLAALLILKLFLKDPLKRGLIVSTLLLLFFSYGHFRNLAVDMELTVNGNAHYIIFPIWLIIITALVYLIIKTRKDLNKFTRFLNITATLLVVFQLLSAGYTIASRPSAESASAPKTSVVKPEYLPDIYYLILDGYGRADVLKNIYNVDNSDFLNGLRKRGFFIADSSHSNYCATVQSLTSTLNLDYVHHLGKFNPNAFDRTPMARMLADNRVFRVLKELDYKMVAFASGHTPTQLENADYYFSPGLTLSEFQNILLNFTPVPFLFQSGKNQFDLHRDRIGYIFDKLGELDNIESPKIVFAHFISPHPPFVFDKDGNKTQRQWPFSFADGDHYTIQGGTTAEYIEGYRGQLFYISQKVLETVDKIIEKSEVPPVIIMQGDHGPGSGLYWEDATRTDMYERFSIFNAYYLPGADSDIISDTITPINSFRVVLNQYFGTSLEMLPGYSYYTTRSRPYRFIDVTNYLKSSKKQNQN